MAKINKKPESIYTHEGAKAKRISAESQLRRSVLSCLLWENEFYEDGISISKRIICLCKKVEDTIVSELAIEARKKQNLRHAPLLLCRALAQKKSRLTAKTLERIIQRADELTEFLAIYWMDGRCPLAAQVKKGLAKAFVKFNEYQLAKYNRNEKIKLRDVLFLCHAKPENEEQAELWKRLINNEMKIPDTWEVGLSSGKNKKEVFENLIVENKLGAMAYLRNLRNMIESGIDIDFIKKGLVELKTNRVLPFRFIAAAEYAPMLEEDLEKIMLKNLSEFDKISDETILLVDVSGSMDRGVSGRSELTRLDAACGLAILCREIFSNIRIFSFSEHVVEVPVRHGFSLSDAIKNSQLNYCTDLGEAIKKVNDIRYDRLIVITDEQSHDSVGDPISDRSYLINVASNRNGIGYGKWIHIDGWSESIVRYIIELEK